MKNIIFYVSMFFFIVFVSFVIRGEQRLNDDSEKKSNDPEMIYPTSWDNLNGIIFN